MNDTVGIHYELPTGEIVYTFGFSKKTGTEVISYYFDDGEGGREVSNEDFQLWKPRRDLSDFPNAKDPRLPYVFDLYWDMKRISNLREEVEGHYDEVNVRKLMLEEGIVL